MMSGGGIDHPVVSDPGSSKLLSQPTGLTVLEGDGPSPGPTYPVGFLASGTAVGLKGSGRADMGALIVAPEYRETTASAAVFTRNAFAAAPVVLAAQECELGRLVAVVVNSGNANACTGSAGLEVARSTQKAVAEVIGVKPECVAVSSTGIIGEQMDPARVMAGAREVVDAAGPDGGPAFAESIMTTDRFAKLCAGTLELPSGSIRVGACAKGAGMIAPALATMLCYATTDALLTPEQTKGLLELAVDRTFNKVTVDGEMSTNDSVFLFASGASGVKPNTQQLEQLQASLEALLMRLALMMVADGEGATKVMHLVVENADSIETAEAVARAIADSPLVKTAMHGADPNWGRIISSAGAVLAGRAVPHATLQLCGVRVVRDGHGCELAAEDRTSLFERMKEPEVEMSLDLGLGSCSADVFFADMGHEYISVNAEYHS